jgi:synaptojanin
VLITRRSWAKGGTRFNARGVDLKGNVANFCETEQLLFVKGQVFSHVQIRGSVPLFWKQAGVTQSVEVDPDEQRNE